MTEFEQQQLQKLIEDNLCGALDHLSEDSKNKVIKRLLNAFIRNGLTSRSVISRYRTVDIHKKRGLGGPLARTVVANIKGPYDKQKERANRLAEIDKQIMRLMDEKVHILAEEAIEAERKERGM